MNKKFLLALICLSFIPLKALADAYVPEFSTMKTLRCDFEEIIYGQDNSIITKNRQFRIFRLDDEYSKIYLQKEPIDRILYYGSDKIEFNLQSLTDDSIIMSHTVLDRNSNEYTSTSEITYDNAIFGIRHSKSAGSCKFIN